MATGADMQQTGQAGEHYVAAELCRRGCSSQKLNFRHLFEMATSFRRQV